MCGDAYRVWVGKPKAWRLRGRCTGEDNIKSFLKNYDGKTATEVIWLR
jgi:hypothetical protein